MRKSSVSPTNKPRKPGETKVDVDDAMLDKPKDDVFYDDEDRDRDDR